MTRFTLLLTALLLLIGCGDDTIIVVQDDDGAGGTGAATSSTSSGGDGGTPAAGGAGGEKPSVGGMGGDGGGAGGLGGAGGEPPICPAPPCASGPSTINCDPACGPVNPGCASCTNAAAAPTISIPHGTTELRIAPLPGPLPECDACTTADPPWWNMMIKLPVDAGCIAVDGPDGLGISGTAATQGQTPVAAICGGGATPTGCITSGLGISDGWEPWIILTLNEPVAAPDGGALISITTGLQSTCPPMGCAGGCNGSGG